MRELKSYRPSIHLLLTFQVINLLSLGHILGQDYPELDQVKSLNDSAYHIYNNQPREAIKLSQKVIEISTGDDMMREKVIGYKNMGLAYWRLTEYDSSLLSYQIGLDLSDSIEDELLGSLLINNIGLVYRDRGQYSLSLENYFQALDIQKSHNYLKGVSLVTGNIGHIYQLMGNYEESERYLKEALDLAKTIDFGLPECFYSSVSVKLYSEMGRYKEAQECYLKAVEACTRQNIKYHHSLAMFYHAEVLMELNRPKDALKELKAALQMQQEVGYTKQQAATMNRIGQLYFNIGQISQAKMTFEATRQLAKDHKFYGELAGAYLYLSRIDSLRGNYTDAFSKYQQYHQLADSAYLLQKVHQLSEIRIKYETRQKEIENQVLRSERQLQDVTIARQNADVKFYYTSFGAAVLIILSLVIIVYFIRKNNHDLKILNNQIGQQSKELKKTNDRLQTKNNQLKKTVQQLKDAQNQLVKSEKMAALGVLTAGIAHEINNPVNFVYAGANSLKENIKDIKQVLEAYQEVNTKNAGDKLSKIRDLKSQMDYDKLIEYVDRSTVNVLKGAERTSEIVKGLKTFSRGDDGKFISTDLHECIDNTLVLLSNQYRDRIEIKKDYGKLNRIQASPGKLSQVFVNILVNSIQAIDGPGEIEITTVIEKIDDQSYITIKIRDTGKGMTEKQQARIFEPFYTTKDAGEGTGLGLSISHTIIEEHGGKIEVSSKQNEGTSFSIVLPV